MQSQKAGLRVAGVVFGLVGLAHLLRLIAGIPMTIGGFAFSTPFTVAAFLVPGCLSIWLWMLSLKK